ncbi:hypothetical protein KR222_002501 [Zaprionus bogoriensis]|nr:hypothetical protein KR222_002501 [Zaprionus bogoriensis]
MNDLETRTMPPAQENTSSSSSTSTSTSTSSAVHCKVCDAPFNTLQDCLAHELLKHTIKPQKKLRKCLDAITKLFASEQIQSERRTLQGRLLQAQAGQHLRAILGYYAGNCNALAECYAQVRESILKQCQGRLKVYPFGSLVTGLALKDSDIDLFLEQIDTSSNSMTHRQLFNKMHNFLRRSNCFTDVFAIRHARVPIIRCKHVQSGLSLDINMSSPNSTYNSRFVAELLNRDVRLRELFLFLKIWAKKLKLIGSGSMTSYCLITLIIYGMQQNGQLPTIKQLQARCPVQDVLGVNYAYCLRHVRPLPAGLTTLELIASFFELYSRMEFEKLVLSPYLGCALPVETAFTQPGIFPEYEAQLQAMQLATGERPEHFQYQRCVCVQDPFELQHNVGQSVSQTNLCYLRECFVLAAQACSDKKLLSTPGKFYDYLLFGLAEKLLQEQRLEQLRPAKQRRQGLVLRPEQPPAVAEKSMETTAIEVEPATSSASSPTSPAASELGASEPVVVVAEKLTCTSSSSTSSSTTTTNSPLEGSAAPLMHTHTLTPTNNDLKCLRADFLSKQQQSTKRTIYYYWAECYVDAIKDILANIYALNMKLVEAEPLQQQQQQGTTSTGSKGGSEQRLPRQLTWLISTTLDTWSARSFQRSTKQSFFAQQLQQTIEFIKTRPQTAGYVVNLNGRFTLHIGPDHRELRLELQPMPGDALGLQRQSPLTKFFKSLKNMLCNYNFKEKVISLQYER